MNNPPRPRFVRQTGLRRDKSREIPDPSSPEAHRHSTGFYVQDDERVLLYSSPHAADSLFCRRHPYGNTSLVYDISTFATAIMLMMRKTLKMSEKETSASLPDEISCSRWLHSLMVHLLD